MLKNRVCLVTGTSRGIGRAIAELFAKEGAIVYANAREPGCLTEWSNTLNARDRGRVVPIYFDLAKSAEIKQAIMRIKKEQGRIDVLVNNAGVVTNELLGMISLEKTREMFSVNVFGLLELTQYVASKFMVHQQSGSVINMASMVGLEGCKGQIAYSASKGAVISLTKSMAKELAEHHIRVNAVAPGMIATDRLQNTIKENYKDSIPYIGAGRLGTPEEIAEACLYFASDASSYTTGQVLAIGGGISL